MEQKELSKRYTEEYIRHTNQRDCPRNVPRDVASVFQTHYFIIDATYQRDDVRGRDRQRDLFQFSSHVATVYSPAVAPYMFRWSSRWCVDSHAIVTSQVTCLIALTYYDDFKFNKPFGLHSLYTNMSPL